MGSRSPLTKILMTLAMAIAPAFAHAGSLPPLINFQSVLLDEGGNLLPSGPTTVQFQILDENQAPIYSETQSVEVVKGAVNALVGNGTDSKGTTTGGVPEGIFSGGAPRYLQVQVGSHAPEDPMTIVPVPYAQWSQTCATVADGAVAAGKIAKAAVGFEHLAPDVVSKLADEMSKSQGVVTAQSLGSNGGATQIGVEAKFINSGSSTIQGVLQDIDLSVKKRQEETTFLTGKLNEEVTNRTNALNDEIKNRTDAVAGVQGKLDQEVKDRTTADSGLQGQITKEISDRGAAITSEQQARSTGDSSLQSLLSQEAVTRAGADTAFSKTLSNINNIPGTLSFDKVQTSTPPPSDLNMGGHKISSLGTPTDSKDATTKEYVDQTIASSAQSLPIPVGGVVAGTYVGNGSATQVITLSSKITTALLWVKSNNPTFLSIHLTFAQGVGSQDGFGINSSTSTGVPDFGNNFGNVGKILAAIGPGSITVTGNGNISGVTYTYWAMGY